MSLGYAHMTGYYRTVPAMLGQPQNVADYPYFSNNTGRVVNNATSSKQFCVALPVYTTESGNSYTRILAAGKGSSAGWMSCQAASITYTGAVYAWGEIHDFTDGPEEGLVLAVFNVPASGSAYVCCNMPPGATLDTVGVVE